MLTPYLHLTSVLERLGTWREGAWDWEKEPDWPLIRAGSSQHAGRGLNDGLNVLELGEHADKGEEGAGKVRGGEAGWKVGASDYLLFQPWTWLDRAAFQICLFLL